MKMRLKDKKRAIGLRLEGKTYNEIRSIIPNLSKSTISGWLKNIEFNTEQKQNLEKHIGEVRNKARERSNLARGERRRERIQKIIKEAEKEYLNLSKNPFFLICLSLYWAEGNKKTEHFQFTNSDPRAIKAIMRWLIKICKIPISEIKFRLYMHKIYADEDCEKFWSELTNIPISNFQKTIFKPTLHKAKKNINYKGCVQLRVLKSAFHWRVVGWTKKLIKEYKLN